MTTTRRGATLITLGVALFALTLVLGPAFAAPVEPAADATPSPSTGPSAAPSNDSADPNGERAPRTTLGVQGVGSYTEDGYVAMFRDREMTWQRTTDGSYFDVDRLDNGTLLAAFTERGYDSCGPYEAPCARTGFRIIDPETDTVVSEWTFPVRTHVNSEVHDVDALPGGGFVVADMDRERVFVLRDGEVEWQWNASSHYDAPADPTRTDWLHINDVDRIGEGRYLVSVRNANQLVVVDEEEGVVEIVNEDGDASVLNRQHNPQWLGDGAVLVTDSENHRIVELHRNTDGEWTPAWTLTSADGTPLNWPRDADRLPDGRTLVSDTRNSRVFVVDESGTVEWSVGLDYRALPYEADRLPHGEPVGAPRYGVSEDGNAATETPASETADATPQTGSVATADATVPVLTTLLRLLSTVVRLPRWFDVTHLAALLGSVVLVAAGVVVRLVDLRRGA